MRGFAQVLAAQREERLGASHIFEHPACVLPSLHLHAQAPARAATRGLPGVSARRAEENCKAKPRAKAQHGKENNERVERTMLLMSAFCAWWQQKTDGPRG